MYVPGNTIVIDLTQKDQYQTEFSAVDNTNIVFNGNNYQIKIRHYMTGQNQVGSQVVLAGAAPRRVDGSESKTIAPLYIPIEQL